MFALALNEHFCKLREALLDSEKTAYAQEEQTVDIAIRKC